MRAKLVGNKSCEAACDLTAFFDEARELTGEANNVKKNKDAIDRAAHTQYFFRMYSIVVAYFILIAYDAITESRRSDHAAKTLKGSQFDKGSARLLIWR